MADTALQSRRGPGHGLQVPPAPWCMRGAGSPGEESLDHIEAAADIARAALAAGWLWRGAENFSRVLHAAGDPGGLARRHLDMGAAGLRVTRVSRAPVLIRAVRS